MTPKSNKRILLQGSLVVRQRDAFQYFPGGQNMSHSFSGRLLRNTEGSSLPCHDHLWNSFHRSFHRSYEQVKSSRFVRTKLIQRWSFKAPKESEGCFPLPRPLANRGLANGDFGVRAHIIGSWCWSGAFQIHCASATVKGFYFYLYKHCVFVGVYECVHALHRCVSTLGIFLSCSPGYCLMQGLSLNLEITDPGRPSCCSFPGWGSQGYTTTPSFYVGSGSKPKSIWLLVGHPNSRHGNILEMCSITPEWSSEMSPL